MDILSQEDKFWNVKYKKLFNKKLIHRPLDMAGAHSEHGENNIIDSVFSVVSPQNKIFVDVGAYGARSSNTYKLIEQGWRGILIEANPIQAPEIRTTFEDNKNIKVLEAFVTPKNLEELIDLSFFPANFDFLSMDVDCFEYEIWMNLKEYQPNLICVEINQLETNFDVIDYDPSYSLWKYRKQREGYGGATVGLMNKLAKEKGYDYLCMDVSNAFYIRRDFGSNPIMV